MKCRKGMRDHVIVSQSLTFVFPGGGPDELVQRPYSNVMPHQSNGPDYRRCSRPDHHVTLCFLSFS